MEKKKLVAASTTGKRNLRSRPPLPSAAPWLVLPRKKNGKDHGFYNLLEPNKRNCIKRIPELRRRSYWQSPSHEGWLVVLCDDPSEFNDKNANSSTWECGDCFLWNPLSLEEIKLPNLSNWFEFDNGYEIFDCVLTSPPANNDKTSIVFFLFEEDECDVLLLYCRPGDQQWRSEKFSPTDINGGELFNGSLLCFRDKLYIFFLNDWQLEIKIENKVELVEASESKYPTFSGAGLHASSHRRYVVSFDELFMVHIYHNSRGDICFDKLVTAIQICKFDFSSMVWEELTSLGDQVIFLGETTKACCSAYELGLTRGCLFYTLPGDRSLYKYDLEGRSVSVSLPFLKIPMPFLSGEWVMMRPTVRACDGSRIDNILDNNEEVVNTIDAHPKKINITNKENGVEGSDGVELEEAKSCCILSEDIMDLIASYLPPIDYAHLRAGSRWNRSVLPALNWRTSYVKMIGSSMTFLSPLLVFSEANGSRYYFVDPMQNNEKYLTSDQEILLGTTIRFSKDGWLLMTKGERNIFFYNPFTRESIQLPDLPEQHDKNKSYGISFSSSPTNSDCRVFAITEVMEIEDSVEKVSISFITKGEDIWWSGFYPKPNIYRPCLNNPVFYNGAFYSLDYNGSLGVFKTDTCLFEEILAGPRWLFDYAYPKFLVEYKRTLFLVDLGHLGLSIRIFRLDFSSMEWVRVASLGKHMMLVSNTSCILVVAPNSNMQNKIYLPRLHGDSIIYYSLEKDRCYSTRSQSSIKGFYDTTEPLSCSWIKPNCTTTVGKLEWF